MSTSKQKGSRFVTAFAFSLIIFSAVLHALWNLLAKRALDGKTFVFLTSAIVIPLYLPAAIYIFLAQKPVFGTAEIIAIAGATILHLVYFICLQNAYKIGDYSVVYPVARGTGPLLSTILAVIFLSEQPTPMAMAGIALIVCGVFIISGGSKILAGHVSKKPIAWGLLTGVCIASYTVWDKYAVANVGVSPVLLDYLATIGMALLMTPYALKNLAKLKQEWQGNRLESLTVAALSPLGYMIVLYVLSTEPVFYVAPLREISILIAATLGAKLLQEEQSRRRIVAAAVMFGGVVSLALS